MLWFVSNWRVVALIGACLAGIGLYWLGKHDGRQDAALEAAQATAKAIEQRTKTDEDIRNLDVIGLCVELGGLQSDCDKLRRVEGNSD